MVDHVKPISSHQAAAGTAKCTTPDGSESVRPVVRTVSGSPQSVQLVAISAGICSIAEMPRASQAQLAHHARSPELTRNWVGIAENGMAIQSSRVVGWSTTTWLASSRSRLALVVAGSTPTWALISRSPGAWPVRTRCRYTDNRTCRSSSSGVTPHQANGIVGLLIGGELKLLTGAEREKAGYRKSAEK